MASYNSAHELLEQNCSLHGTFTSGLFCSTGGTIIVTVPRWLTHSSMGGTILFRPWNFYFKSLGVLPLAPLFKYDLQQIQIVMHFRFRSIDCKSVDNKKQLVITKKFATTYRPEERIVPCAISLYMLSASGLWQQHRCTGRATGDQQSSALLL